MVYVLHILVSVTILFCRLSKKQSRLDGFEIRVPASGTRGTKERARLGWPFFGGNFFILKTMMFREVATT